MSVLADAGENVERLATGRGGVLRPVGREQRKTMLFREIDQLAIDPFFAPDEMALDLNIDAVATKCVD